jgi:hypothetical protein
MAVAALGLILKEMVSLEIVRRRKRRTQGGRGGVPRMSDRGKSGDSGLSQPRVSHNNKKVPPRKPTSDNRDALIKELRASEAPFEKEAQFKNLLHGEGKGSAQNFGKPRGSKPANEHAKPIPTSQIPDLADLLTEIEQFTRVYVILDSDQACTVALWVVHTWAIDAADTTLYLRVTSPQPRCGKSTLQRVLAELVRIPWKADRVSAAALYRKIQAVRPTLLLDEMDAAFKSGDEYSEALRGILNSGHARGGAVTVCVNKGEDFKDFSTFCPKAFAGLGKLANTLMDRSVQILMRRKIKSEHVARSRHRELKEAARPIVGRLANWHLQVNMQALRDARPALPEELDDRAQDGWEPLLAIADMAGSEWPDRARRAALHLSAGANRTVDEDNVGVNLLRDVRDIFTRHLGKDRWPTEILLLTLNKGEDSSWGSWHNGLGMNARDLAKVLFAFEVDPVTRPGVRIGPRKMRVGSETPNGYHAEDFKDAFARYLQPVPPDDPESSSGVGSHSTPEQPEQPALDVAIAGIFEAEHTHHVPDAENAQIPHCTGLVEDVLDESARIQASKETVDAKAVQEALSSEHLTPGGSHQGNQDGVRVIQGG